MADLSDLQASLSIKLAGADPSTGIENYYAQVDATGSMQVEKALRTGGQNRNQSVTTSAAEALGAATILTNRQLLTVTPIDGTVYWGYSSGVTTANGSPIFKNQMATWDATEGCHIYLISAGAVNCRITEGS